MKIHYLFVFVLIPTLSHSTPLEKKDKEVIKDVSSALGKSSKDKKVKKAAKKTEEMAKDDCPPPTDPVVVEKAKSPIDGAEEYKGKKKVELFFNLQLLVTSKNGESSFQEVGVPRINYGSEIGRYASRNGMSRAQVLALGDEKIREILMASSSSLTGQAKEDAVDNAMLVARLASFGGDPKMYDVLGKEMSKANFGRKVNFLANFLSYLNDNYDFDSIAPGAAHKSVSDEDMMKAIQESIRTGRAVPAGVCRHMHQLAIRMAQAMGIQEAFGVGFRTTGGSGHRTLVLTHPDDPTKVIQLNYGAKSEQDGVSGPAALSQSHSIPDTGIKFRIFNGKDEHAINLPTEQGAILNKVTGGEDSDLSPNHRTEAQIQQFGIGTPYGTVRFFHAETPAGTQTKMMGGAYSVKVNYNDIFYGEYGIAGFTSERPVQGGKLQVHGGYGRMTQGFHWKFYQSDNLKLSTFGELHARGSVYCSKVNDGECETNSDYQVDLMSGVMARYQTGPLKHRTSLVFQTQFEQDSATNGQGLSVKLPVVKLSHDMDFKIASDVNGNLGASVTMYNLGTGTYWTYNGHGGISSPKTGTYFGVSADGRLTRDTPFWIPGAEHSASAVIQQSIFKDRLYVGVDGKQSFDVKDNRYIGLSIGGRF